MHQETFMRLCLPVLLTLGACARGASGPCPEVDGVTLPGERIPSHELAAACCSKSENFA